MAKKYYWLCTHFTVLIIGCISFSSGLGLGLYLAHQIVEAHGGILSVHSVLEQGTCFVLALPGVMNKGEIGKAELLQSTL